MKKTTFQRYLRSVPNLTRTQRHDLKAAIEQADRKNVEDEVTSLVGTPACCPHCGDSRHQPWGHAHGLSRYRCLGCKRTFNALTNTPLSGLHHKDRWLLYLEGFASGESIRKAARRCVINKKAAFHWRHCFLALPAKRKARQESGIVEADETYFLRSYKGQRGGLPRQARKRGGRASKRGLSGEQVPVLVVRDRSGATSDAILPKDDHRAIETVLKPLLARDAVLCSDGGGKGPIALAAREMGIAHRAVNLSKGVRVLAGVYHIQNANAYHSRLKGWMRRFHGVATRYLDHYLGWDRMLETFGEHLTSALWLVLAVGRYNLQHEMGT
jgi:transposase-like protein